MNDPKVQSLINQLMAQSAPGMASYEDPTASYELQAFESFLTKNGVQPYMAKQKALQAMAEPATAQKLRAAMNKAGQGLMAIDDDIAATITLTVTRNTAAIALDLPIAMFGAIAARNGYRQALLGYLPAGVVLTSVLIGETDGRPNDARFTFTQGANVDTIDITCDAYPYPSVLESTITDTLSANMVRLELSDKTITGQFRQPLIPSVANMFGAGSTNQATPSVFRAPTDYDNGIVDIPARIDFDKETAAIVKIKNVAAFSANFTWFVRQFKRTTSKNLGA